MNNYKKPFLIAEIGCNHMGNIDTAKELILLAKSNGANAAKFQKRNNKKLLTDEQYNAPHPNPQNSYGDTYGKHREFLEFNLKQHLELKNYTPGRDRFLSHALGSYLHGHINLYVYVYYLGTIL